MADDDEVTEVVFRLVSVHDESFIVEVAVSVDEGSMFWPRAMSAAIAASMGEVEAWAEAATLTHVPEAPLSWRLLQ